MATSDSMDAEPARTALYNLHVARGGRMVDFADYALPVQYTGIMAEHEQTRTAASLFDVSHMGQARVTGARAVEAIESLAPGDIAGLAPGRMRYTQLTNDAGGILDDLMVTRLDDGLLIVVNAACKEDDFAHIDAALGAFGCAMAVDGDVALLALQGPKAEAALAEQVDGVAALTFMQAGVFSWQGASLWISRSGYTGEDGFEISIANDRATGLAEALLADDRVEPAGLGARDSLRLEAGLCLYGHDIDAATTPVEAGLTWSIGKRRREEGGFPGATVIQQQLADGPARRRVGLKPEGRAPAREGAVIEATNGAGIGRVTSGGFGPTVGGPVAMGYVDTGHAATGTGVNLVVRGKPLPATVAKLPFITPGYKR